MSSTELEDHSSGMAVMAVTVAVVVRRTEDEHEEPVSPQRAER
ncbi:hypothetical protein [Yinghuangia sp. YIM S09857]